MIRHFIPPTGSHTVYNKGDRILFIDGRIYESVIDNNVWPPGEYSDGWKLIL